MFLGKRSELLFNLNRKSSGKSSGYYEHQNTIGKQLIRIRETIAGIRGSNS